MAVCPECGETVAPSGGDMVFGYAFATDEDGNRIKDSEATMGLFHPECWKAWKAKYPLPEEDPPDPDQMIEDIGGGPPRDD
jgi:hypothetical protein